ncbi:MAG: lipid-A-disaccharide synthase [Proteobacteria bacterium]|nr:MAG: lipid-A-disaccharide synthase [Pseudomonadota bacterium]
MTSCLEASANLHLEPILDHLKDYELFGIFDERFGKPYMGSSAFGVMGFIDVLSKIPMARKAIKEIAKMSLGMDHVLLVDSPAFNIPLAKQIRKINPHVKITYYILPQVWAWKAKRVKVVEALCDNLASILPFEKDFYTKSIYVGHPLLDEIKIRKESLTYDNLVAFLPGSRKSEIKKLLPIFKEVAKNLPCKPLLVIPPFFSDDQISDIYADISEFEISHSIQEALAKSDFAYVCSGTATLEASLIGTPFVLVYKAKWLDYQIAKRFVKLDHIGIANIIFDFAGEKELHPEFLQEDVNVQNLLDAYENMDRFEFLNKSKKLRKLLKHGSSENVAKLIAPTK